MYKLPKPLYHGTYAGAAILVGIRGFRAPIYLAEDKRIARHYARAAAAYVEDYAEREGIKLLKKGYAIFTFYSLPNRAYLVPDTYATEERGQWIYLRPIRGLQHYTVRYYPLVASKGERLRLYTFAIGMWGG